MIIDSLLLVVLGLLNTLLWIAEAITYAIPDQIAIATAEAIAGLGYLKAFFPIDTLLIAMTFYIQFIIVFYTFNVIRWAYAHIPWFGKHKKLPNVE